MNSPVATPSQHNSWPQKVSGEQAALAAANGSVPATSMPATPAVAIPQPMQNGTLAWAKSATPAPAAKPPRPSVPPLTDAQLSALLVANGATPEAAQSAVQKCRGGVMAEVANLPCEVGHAVDWMRLAKAVMEATDPAKTPRQGVQSTTLQLRLLNFERVRTLGMLLELSQQRWFCCAKLRGQHGAPHCITETVRFKTILSYKQLRTAVHALSL